MSCRMMNRAIATALEQLSRTRRRRAVAEMKIVERRGEAGVDQEIDDFLLGFTRREPKSRAQRRNRIAPAALAEVRPAQVEIGFAVFGIAPRCLFQIRHRFSKSSLIEQRQAVVKTILSRAEMGQRAGAHECNDKGQNHDGASVLHGETPSLIGCSTNAAENMNAPYLPKADLSSGSSSPRSCSSCTISQPPTNLPSM